MTIQAFLLWLASGLGANVVVSYVVERWMWFQNLTVDTKKYLSMMFTALIAIGAYATMTYVPASFWLIVSPYWEIIVVVVGMYIGTQTFHQVDKTS